MSLNAAWSSYDDFFDDQYLDPVPTPKPSEETTQDTLDLREEIVYSDGRVYEVSTTKTGLMLYTGKYPVVPVTPDPEPKQLPKMLILPSSMNPGNGGLWGLKKGSGQTVKMNPMTAVAIRSKTADKK